METIEQDPRRSSSPLEASRSLVRFISEHKSDTLMENRRFMGKSALMQMQVRREPIPIPGSVKVYGEERATMLGHLAEIQLDFVRSELRDPGQPDRYILSAQEVLVPIEQAKPDLRPLDPHELEQFYTDLTTLTSR